MRLGLLADTHLPGTRRDLWEEVRQVFTGVDLILHAGDIVTPRVLDWLEELAPTLAVRGNNDDGWDDPRLVPMRWLHLEGWRLVMVHDMEPEERPIAELRQRYLRGAPADVIITGHTHVERLAYRDGVVQINPGSPIHPHLTSTRLGTVALLDLTPDTLTARILRLGELPSLPNPGREHSLAVQTSPGSFACHIVHHT